MKDFTQIMQSLRQGDYRPVYFLQGEEPFFIQQIADYIAQHALSEAEKGFNQSILYGNDLDVATLVDTARRLPMMAERQVVIVREAQAIRDVANKLENYFTQPVPSTILVLQYMGKKIRANSKSAKAIKKNGVLFTANKLKDYELPGWIENLVNSRGTSISSKASALLASHLGNDLSRIVHSLEKLEAHGQNRKITPEAIEEYIGISKEFNVFEFRNALLAKDAAKAFRIAAYFSANPKACPFPLLMFNMYDVFSKLLWVAYHPGASDKEIAGALRVHPFFVKDYKTALRVYSIDQMKEAIRILHEVDLMFKGVGTAPQKEGALIQEMTVKLMS